MSQSPNARNDELDQIRTRIMLTINFFDQVEAMGAISDSLRDVVRTAYEKKSLREMRLIARDVDAMTIAIPAHQREGLEAILKSQVGVDTEQERETQKLEVAKSLKRGIVLSEKERRRLEDYAEMLEATNGDAAELAAVRALISSAF